MVLPLLLTHPSMRLKAKLMQNAVLSKTVEVHLFFPLWSPITWDLLKYAFLEEIALLQARGHPEMENLHPLIFASSTNHPHGYNHVLFFPFDIACLLLPATASPSTVLCLAREPFMAEHLHCMKVCTSHDQGVILNKLKTWSTASFSSPLTCSTSCLTERGFFAYLQDFNTFFEKI